ncbi:cation diffusion facilitator family transporter [Dactylosporangium sp. AC04546]|uniref:cation diffusion facilitator family transporter n=1 Tax=Dactylosporangium sp. AC04546 TaxID=2862460 RepID=UPI001EE09E40|nr:cation diffusion facilitator family transporter [Dactylosporangium sp. AC04546]WVK79451.1 cation diffusion facilitator family transporter [Dactylosporangium sp. AC04546]
MAADGGSTRAVVTALAANLGIAVSKGVGALITGSSSMLAEAVHSLADTTNQALLLVGGRRARREADEKHPFGYARERYIYAFIVSIVLFTLGGLFALYEGYEKIRHPHELTSPLVAVVILVVAIGLEGYALYTAAKSANAIRGTKTWWQFIRHAKAPELPTILLEDAGAVTGLVVALLGVGLSVLTGDPVFDGIGTFVIGALLVAIAVILAMETKSLLVGESASKAHIAKIREALLAEPRFDRVIHLRTMHLGPDELLVAVKVAVAPGEVAEDISVATNNAEARIRAQLPIATLIFVEPDIYQPQPAAPSGAS